MTTTQPQLLAAPPMVRPRSLARIRTSLARAAGLGTALAASAVLLAVPPAGAKPKPAAPALAALAWPRAQRGSITANLKDGTAYEPLIFLDAQTSVGTAESPDGRSLRLLLRGADASVRQLRSLPVAKDPSFQTFAVAGNELAWAEGSRGGHTQLWLINLRDGKPAKQVTADTGDAVFYRSQYDLVIAEGRLHWAAAGPNNATEIRSVALTGGPVDTRVEPGNWELSAWPWLVNGVTEAAGTTGLRNLATNQDVAVAGVGNRSATNCSPTWCRVVTLARDGYNNIDLMHPDGTARRRIAGGTATTVIADTAPLDRFDILAEQGPTSDLTGNVELIAVEIATHRTIEVSPDAGKVAYRDGVLWWSTGSLDTFVWHSIDLRTV